MKAILVSKFFYLDHYKEVILYPKSASLTLSIIFEVCNLANPCDMMLVADISIDGNAYALFQEACEHESNELNCSILEECIDDRNRGAPVYEIFEFITSIYKERYPYIQKPTHYFWCGQLQEKNFEQFWLFVSCPGYGVSRESHADLYRHEFLKIKSTYRYPKSQVEWDIVRKGISLISWLSQRQDMRLKVCFNESASVTVEEKNLEDEEARESAKGKKYPPNKSNLLLRAILQYKNSVL